MPIRIRHPLLSLFFSHLILSVSSDTNSELCKIDILEEMHPSLSPLVLCSSSSTNKLIYPLFAAKDSLIFHRGQVFKVFCPFQPNFIYEHIAAVNNLLVNGQKIPQYYPIDIECLGNNKFKINQNTMNFRDISCETNQGPTLVKEKRCSSCNCYKIGYPLDTRSEKYLDIIKFCHDEKNVRTFWAKSTTRPRKFEHCDGGNDDKEYKSGILYDEINMDVMDGPYNLEKQFRTFSLILENDDNARKFIDPDVCSDYYLVPGPLISSQDKYYSNEEEATYFHANFVPIWLKIHSGNWRQVESYIKKLANQVGRELEIWAGGIDILKLGQVKRAMHLYHDTSGWKLPIPKVLFKCIADKMLEEGLCFLVVNNPFLIEPIPKEYIYCKMQNACNDVFIDYNDSELGFTYCCKLDDFREGIEQKARFILDDFEEISNFDFMEMI